MTIALDINKHGSLYCILSSLLQAYDRRTDVMERAVELDERIKQLIHKLDNAGEPLREAVKNNQPSE